MRYVTIDPSGSFNEGKGHTGISFIKDWDWDTLETYSIAAKDFDDRHLYWNKMIQTIIDKKPDAVIIESFVVRANGFLVGKMPETSLFIGALIWELEQLNIDYVFQSPSQAKTRFKDEYLGKYIPNYEVKDLSGKKYYYLNGKQTNDHVRDSLKHLLYFKKYNLKEEE
jgi:hypothetical protein